MRLKTLTIKGFRCFSDVTVDCDRPLLVLIGENDAGKSSVLDAIETVWGARRPGRGDFRRDNTGGTAQVELTCDLAIEGDDEIDKASTVDGSGEVLRVRRKFSDERSVTNEVFGLVPADNRYERFGSLKAAEQKELLRAAGLEPEANAERRVAQFNEAKGDLPTKPAWRSVSPKWLADVLPDLQRVSAASFEDPESELQRLAERAVRERLQQHWQGHRDDLAEVETLVREAVKQEIDSLTPHLRGLLPGFREFQVTPEVDFARPHIRAKVDIDLGRGSRDLSELGYGSRRRAWLALEQRRAAVGATRSALRLYDEPDAHLHYAAQKVLFRAIRTMTDGTATRAIVCTHAVTLIDGAPPASLRLLDRDADGVARITRVGGESASRSEDLDALAEVGPQLGLNNLALLYERAFLLVEGDTEEAALPPLYKTLFGSSMRDDGIRLVNLAGCGAWSSVVRVLTASRAPLIHLFLDSDVVEPDSTAKITEERLADYGLTMEQVSLVGAKEFEDAFGDAIWVRVLQKHFPRTTGDWREEDVAKLRNDPKFSSALIDEVFTLAMPATRSRLTKPKLGLALGAETDRESIPTAVTRAFSAVRSIAGHPEVPPA